MAAKRVGGETGEKGTNLAAGDTRRSSSSSSSSGVCAVRQVDPALTACRLNEACDGGALERRRVVKLLVTLPREEAAQMAVVNSKRSQRDSSVVRGQLQQARLRQLVVDGVKGRQLRLRGDSCLLGRAIPPD